MASAVNALNTLLRGTSIEDHDEALRLANAAIRTGDRDAVLAAQQAKVVALLKLDRFGDALRTLAEGGDAVAARCVLEHAYALYKTGDLAAAAALLDKASTSTTTATATPSRTTRALQHVAAQVAYRDEQFDRAAALYEDLATGDAAEALDVQINTLATAAQQSWAAAAAFSDATAPEAMDLFETAYNAGSAALASGDAARAAVLLRRAQQLCEASDDLADDDKSAELLPILVQQTCALEQLGRRADAVALFRAVDLAAVAAGASATKAVAQTNAVLLADADADSATPNPYLLLGRLNAVAPAPSAGSDRLFAHQARLLRHNRFALELQCFKFSGVQSRTTQQLRAAAAAAQPDPTAAATVDLGILHAAAAAALQDGPAALRRLRPLLDSRPDDVGLLLTVVQLHLRHHHNPAAAVALLESFLAAAPPAVRFAPGLVALAVALYRRQGRHAAVRAALAAAVQHWQTASSGSAPSLLRAAGVELLRSPHGADQAVAAAAFETLHAADPTDRVAIAGLVAAAAATPLDDRQRALAATLTPVDHLVAGIDVDALLAAGVVARPAPAATTAAAGKKRGRADAGDGDADDAAAQPAKKAKTPGAAPAPKPSRRARKLQAKLGDDFDAATKLDPERWLPLRDRSSYRPPKGKKGRRRGADAATMQGGVVREEETLALAGGAGSVKVEKAPQGSAGGGAKKRKKGKK